MIDVHHLTLTANSDYDQNTLATSATSGGTAVAAVVANLVAHEDTLVEIGTGSTITVYGDLTLAADHQGEVSTQAQGDAEGATDAAVGVAIAVSIVNQRTEATLSRDMTVLGLLSMTATEESINNVESTATAQGAEG